MYPVYYVEENDTLVHMFDTFDGGTGASLTMTGLAVTDIEIYKDGSTTQRSSDAGYTLLDTDGIDFDTITGIHGFSIDLSNNTDAGFYSVGPWYHVVVSSITVDAQTVNFIACAFRIVSATRGMAGTALPAAAADAAGGLVISDAGGLDIDGLNTNVSAILSDTGTDGVVVASLAANSVTASALATDAVNEIVDQVWDELIAGHAGVGSTGEQLAAAGAAGDPWATALPGAYGAGTAGKIVGDNINAPIATVDTVVDGIATTLGTPAGASVSVDIAAVKTQTAAIETDTQDIQSRLPAALVGGRMSSDAVAISGDTTTADNLQTLFDGAEGFYGAYAGPRGLGVYLNDAAANTNTTNGVDGTVGNPVSTIAAAKTIADSMSLDRIYLVNDSDITLAATMTDYEFVGIGASTGNIINLGSQDVSNSSFYNLTLEGTQGGTGRILAVDCALQDPGAGDTTLHIFAVRCGIVDRIQVDTSNDNVFEGCYSLVAGTATPIIQATGAAGTLTLRHYSGGIEFESLSASHNVSVETDGQVIFAADCNVNATVAVRGNLTITDNTAGMNNLTQTAALNRTVIADAIWDEATSGHVTAGTTGVALTDILADTNELQADDYPTSIAAVQTTANNIETDTQNIQTRLPAALVSGAMDSNVSGIQNNAITAASIAADAIGASELAADAATEIVEALLKYDMTSLTGEADRSPANALRHIRNKWTISGGTLTVYKEDDATSAWTASVTTGSSDPVSSVDPA